MASLESLRIARVETLEDVDTLADLQRIAQRASLRGG
jgi:hypothetical protein